MASERVIVVDGVEHHFPSDATDEEVSAALNGSDAPRRQDTHGGLELAAAGPAVRGAANLAERVATSPTLPATAAKVGRLVGGVTSMPAGLSGFGDVQRGVWAGGKSGWFTGKLIQNVANPIARWLDTVAPIAERLNPLGIAQGALDLQQMAEPHRKDIGFLGIGGGTSDPNDPAVLNMVAAKLRALFGGQ